MRRAVFVAAFAAAVQAGDVAVTERSGGEILPAADTYVFVCPSGAADAVGVPGTKLSVVAVWDKLAAEADCEQAEIDAALPKYLARVSSAEGPALLEAYGEHAVRLAPEYFIIATAETTPWKVRPRSVLLLLPFTRRVTHRRSATALDVYLPYKLGVMENILTPELKYLVQSLSGAREIQTLVDHTALFLSTRHTTSVDIKYAGIWIHEWLVEFAVCDSVRIQVFVFRGKSARNYICVRTGTIRPDEVVVVGAHYDSIGEEDTDNVVAPGAIDNGSGTASVMLVAKKLRDFDMQRTVHFVFFTGQQQGAVGSTHYVAAAQEEGVDIKLALIMDMTAYSAGWDHGVIFEGTLTNADNRGLLEQAVTNLNAVNDNFRSGLSHEISYDSFGSDHVPFQKAGIAAILLTSQSTDFPGYGAADTVAYANWELMRDIARVIVGQIMDYAGEG